MLNSLSGSRSGGLESGVNLDTTEEGKRIIRFSRIGQPDRAPGFEGSPSIEMKTNHVTKRIMGGARSAGKPVSVKTKMPIFQEVTRANLIQWPSEQEIEEVSKRLAKISRAGIRWEASGDYFNSGDLAYQIQEIIHSTAELFKKSQRLKS